MWDSGFASLLSRFRDRSLLVVCHQFDSYISLFALCPPALSLTGYNIRVISEPAPCRFMLSRFRLCHRNELKAPSNFRDDYRAEIASKRHPCCQRFAAELKRLGQTIAEWLSKSFFRYSLDIPEEPSSDILHFGSYFP
jgi:hypothetical protein